MNTVTLQDAILAIADTVRDVVRGTTDASAVNRRQLIDGDMAGTRDKWWQNSQLILLEPGATLAGMANPNPYEIRDFDANSGTFTLNQDFNNAAGVPSGISYALIRTRGNGHPYNTYLNAIRYALDKMDTSAETLDDTLTTVAGTFTYVVPSGLNTVYDVYFSHPTLGYYSLRPDWWDTMPGRRLILKNRNLDVASGYTLELHGTVDVTLPTTLNGTINVDFEELIDQAQEYLLRTSPRNNDAAKSQGLTQERLRFTNTYVHPNERELY